MDVGAMDVGMFNGIMISNVELLASQCAVFLLYARMILQLVHELSLCLSCCG